MGGGVKRCLYSYLCHRRRNSWKSFSDCRPITELQKRTTKERPSTQTTRSTSVWQVLNQGSPGIRSKLRRPAGPLAFYFPVSLHRSLTSEATGPLPANRLQSSSLLLASQGDSHHPPGMLSNATGSFSGLSLPPHPRTTPPSICCGAHCSERLLVIVQPLVLPAAQVLFLEHTPGLVSPLPEAFLASFLHSG